MKIEHVMTKKIVTVEMDDPLNEVYAIFKHTKFHHLLVVEQNKLVGIISDRDLFKTLSPNIGTVAETTRDVESLNRKAHQIMTRKLITAEVGTDVYKLIELFNNNLISCIPVVDADDVPVGIVSWRDIFKLLKRKQHK